MKLITDEESYSIEKNVLCYLITSAEFCTKYLNIFENKKVFKELGAGIIEEWCVRYFRRYKTAINSCIVEVYNDSIRKKEYSADVYEYIGNILSNLSNLSDQERLYSIDYVLDKAIEYKNKKDLEFIADKVKENISKGDAKKAVELVQSFKAIENKTVQYVDLVKDSDKAIDFAFSEEDSNIIAIPGDAGKYLNSLFVPASFVLVRGSAKSKKSFTLNYLQTHAVIQKNNVLVLQLGDLTDRQIFRRQLELLTKRTLKTLPEHVRIPCLDCLKSQDGSCMHVDKLSRETLYNQDGSYNDNYVPCSICRNKRPFPFTASYKTVNAPKKLDKDTANKYIGMLKEHLGDNNSIRILSYPAKSFSASDLERLLEQYSKEEKPFVPSVIIIDSENLMKSDIPNADINTETTERFIILNRIRMKYNVCMLVGDQTRGREIYKYNDSLGVETMDSESWSGSTNKDRYTTGIINLGRKSICGGTQVVTTSLVRDGGGIPDDSFLLLFQDLNVADICMDSFVPSPEDIKCRLEYIENQEKTRRKQK